MNNMRRTNQGISNVGFIIIAVILTVSLLSAVYVLNKRGDQVRKDEATKIANEQKTSNPVINPVSVDAAADKDAPTVKEADSLPVTGAGLSINELAGVFMLPMMATAYTISKRDLKRCL